MSYSSGLRRLRSRIAIRRRSAAGSPRQAAWQVRLGDGQQVHKEMGLRAGHRARQRGIVVCDVGDEVKARPGGAGI